MTNTRSKMTSDNDKKAAEEYAFILGRSNRTPNPVGDFLAGCAHKQKEIDELLKQTQQLELQLVDAISEIEHLKKCKFTYNF